MAVQHNNTYAGQYTLPGGCVVQIKYFDRTAAAQVFGPQISRQPNRKGIGWYWQANGLSEWHGPHRGSLQAVLDVMGPASPIDTTMGAEAKDSPA